MDTLTCTEGLITRQRLPRKVFYEIRHNDNIIYSGLTNNPTQRLAQHKYTIYHHKSQLNPWKFIREHILEDQLTLHLVCSQFSSHNAAAFEAEMKRLRSPMFDGESNNGTNQSTKVRHSGVYVYSRSSQTTTLFKSTGEIAKAHNLCPVTVNKCIRRLLASKRPYSSHKGLILSFSPEHLGQALKRPERKYKPSVNIQNQGQPCRVTNLVSGVTQDFQSIGEACRALKLNRGAVYKIQKGTLKSHNGFLIELL